MPVSGHSDAELYIKEIERLRAEVERLREANWQALRAMFRDAVERGDEARDDAERFLNLAARALGRNAS
jgi:hypothetical protein